MIRDALVLARKDLLLEVRRREVVLANLRFVAERPAGSEITFDYFTPPADLPWIGRIFFQVLAWRLAFQGEPWRTWFAPAELGAELRAMGFTALEDLDSPALNRRFYDGRLPSLGGRGVGRVMTAAK